MGHEDAVGRLAERQGEAVEGLGGAVPDVAVGQHGDRGREGVAIALAHETARAVGADEQIGVGKGGGILAARAEVEGDAASAAVRLENAEQGEPRDAGEAEPVDAYRLAAVDNGLITPALEPRLEVAVRLRIGVGEEAEGALGEDHAPAVGGAGRVLLDDADLVAGIGALHEQGEIEPGRPAAHDGDLHRVSSIVCRCSRTLSGSTSAAPSPTSSSTTTRRGRQWSRKVLTTHDDPARAVAAGVAGLLRRARSSRRDFTRVVHATTLFTNALIERKGAVTGLITTAGFADTLEIGRERKFELYDLSIEQAGAARPARPAARGGRAHRRRRHACGGRSTRARLAAPRAAGWPRPASTSIAMVFLHAYANPRHEAEAARLVAAPPPARSP